MNMKQHILAALREQINQWEELLGSLREDQIFIPLVPSDRTVKDEIAHLMVWQQRSIARVEAAQFDQEPQFPQWLPGVNPDAEGSPDETNAWIYENHRGLPWSVVHQSWREGYQRFIAGAEKISERDLLDSSRYAWLNGYSLALVLIASYDHHQEHYEKLQAWLQEHDVLHG